MVAIRRRSSKSDFSWPCSFGQAALTFFLVCRKGATRPLKNWMGFIVVFLSLASVLLDQVVDVGHVDRAFGRDVVFKIVVLAERPAAKIKAVKLFFHDARSVS